MNTTEAGRNITKATPVALPQKSQRTDLMPRSFDEAMRFAEAVAKSALVPDGYRNKPADVLLAIIYGQSVGLTPLAALTGIAVVGGKPSLYGDALAAVCRGHGDFEGMEETFDRPAMTAICRVKRRGQAWVEQTFSQADAKRAGLWDKRGPWQHYPERMLQMRARGFALRDAFPDALAGFISEPEARDYPEVVKDLQATVTVPGSQTKTEAIRQRVAARMAARAPADADADEDAQATAELREAIAQAGLSREEALSIAQDFFLRPDLDSAADLDADEKAQLAVEIREFHAAASEHGVAGEEAQ